MLSRWKLGLLGLSFFVFLPNLLIPYLGGDEASRHVICREAFTGKLYTEVTNNKPPLEPEINYLITLGRKVFLADHYFFAFWIFLAGLALYFILRRFFRDDTAKLGAFMFVLFSAMTNYGAGANERMYVPLLIFATLFAFQRNEIRSPISRLVYELLIGAFVGAAALIKPTAILFAFVPWLIELQDRETRGFHLFQSSLRNVFGALIATFFAWSLTDVPFRVIIDNAYLTNVQYVKAAIDPARFDAFKNTVYVLFVQYLPLSLGSLYGLYLLKKKQRLHLRGLGLTLAVWTALTVLSISLGGRVQQPYFIAALPLLVFMTCTAHSLTARPKRFLKFLCVSGILIVLGYHSYIYKMQIEDKNPYWDSQMKHLIDEIKADTNPDDYIWLSHGVSPAYVYSDRRPAVRHVFILGALGQIDLCKSPDSLLRENLELKGFQELLEDLRNKPPKIIFWAQRPGNGCVNRLKIENFPSIHQFIKNSYALKWENEFGKYFENTH